MHLAMPGVGGSGPRVLTWEEQSSADSGSCPAWATALALWRRKVLVTEAR